MTISGALDEGTTFLEPFRPRTPRLDAEVLLGHVLGEPRTRLYARSFQSLSEADVKSYFALLEQRKRGVPIAYLVGHKEFFSRRFLVTPDVLIPRPETELLVEEAARQLQSAGLVRPRVLDIGTGTGCVAISIALECPDAVVRATDISRKALEVAEVNVAHHGLQRSLKLLQGDLFAPREGRPSKYDLIVSNPPYVATDLGPRPEENVVRNEPNVALFAGYDGFSVIRPMMDQAPRHLNSGGHLLIEMAPFQIEGAEAMMVERGFQATRILADLSGLPRVLMGRWEV